MAKLKKWNHLKRETIHVGQRLTIYRSGGPMAQVSSSTNTNSKSSASKSSTSKSSTSKTVKTHTVKKGETLSSISRKYGCTVNDLKKWNGLKSNTVRVGQKLKIKK